LKQEIHPVGERSIKKHRVIIDGKKLKEGEFATELAGTMGAIASANIYSVGNLTTMLEQKDQEITQLQDRLKENERNIGWGIQKGLEQARLKDMQEIQKLNKDLDEAKHLIQVTQEQVQKLGEENKQLHDKINFITNQVVELGHFRTQASEIYARIEEEQQKVLWNLEIIQNYFQESNKSMENVFQKEREAKAARTTFQKAVASSLKEEIGKNQKLSISEQVKGDIMIKVWESKLAEYKRITKEVNEDCQGIFDLVEKDSLNIGTDGCSRLLGEVNIAKHQLRFREELEEKKAEISNIKLINITEINKWMVNSSLKLKTVKFTESMIESRLPELQRRFFSFEANEIPEAPRILVNFLGKCVQCVETEKGSASTQT
jgi:chromosome segregation ATPase